MLVGLLLVPMMILLAFTLDLGIAYAQAQAFAAGADSGALAIAGAKRTGLTSNAAVAPTCASILSNDAGQALAIAKKQADANRPYDLKASTGQVDVQTSLTCDAAGILRVKRHRAARRADHPRPARRHQLDQGHPPGERRAQCRREHERRGLPAHHL